MSLDFSFFEEVSGDPQNQLKKYLSEGKKVVGCYHIYTPEPIVYAAGAIPFGMWGEEIEAINSKKFFPSFICGIMHTNLEMGISGRCNGMSAVMIPMLCDSLICASENWKYAVPDIPVISIAYPHRRTDSSKVFFRAELTRIKQKLEKAVDTVITDGSIRFAIALYNKHHAALREFCDLVSTHPAEVTPAQRNAVISSSFYMDKAEHLKHLIKLNNELEALTPARFRGIRVLTTGMICDSHVLLDIFHENKVSVAVDEVAHESRQFRVDYNEELSPIDAVADQYMQMYGCSVLLDNAIPREEYILSLAKQYKVDGVIMLMTKFCDPEEYDHISIKRRLNEEEIPFLSIETDKQMANYGQAHTAVQTFQEMIRL